LAPGSGGGVVVKTRQLAVLALASAALVVLALVDPWQQQDAVRSDRLVSSAQFASLKQVTLVDSAGAAMSIEKDVGGEWRSVDQGEAPLDDNAVRELLAVMKLLRALRESPQSETRTPRSGGASLQYAWDQGSRQLRFGSLSADGKHQWVGLGEEGPALLVEAYLLREIQELRGRLLSRKLLRSWPNAASPLELRRGEEWLRVAAQRVQWNGRDAAAPAALSETRAVQLRDDLAQLEFREALPPGAACKPEGLALQVQAGEQVLAIHSCSGCEPGSVGLVVGARTGCADASVWQRIVSLLVSPTELVELRFLPSREAPKSFTLACGQGELLIDAEAVDASRLQGWWHDLDASATSVSEGTQPFALCSLRGADFELRFGQRDGQWFALPAGGAEGESGLLYHLRPEAGALLHVGRAAFLSLGLISEDPLTSTRIAIREAGRERVLERGELADLWRAVGWPASDLAASQWALGLRSALSHLRATSIVEAGAPVPSASSGRRITIDFALPTSEGTRRYQLWVAPDAAAAKGSGECWVQVNAESPAWVAPETCALLLMDGP
jgi:hypothetical protein